MMGFSLKKIAVCFYAKIIFRKDAIVNGAGLCGVIQDDVVIVTFFPIFL